MCKKQSDWQVRYYKEETESRYIDSNAVCNDVMIVVDVNEGQ